jgi:hypothetical protein
MTLRTQTFFIFFFCVPCACSVFSVKSFLAAGGSARLGITQLFIEHLTHDDLTLSHLLPAGYIDRLAGHIIRLLGGQK